MLYIIRKEESVDPTPVEGALRPPGHGTEGQHLGAGWSQLGPLGPDP